MHDGTLKDQVIEFDERVCATLVAVSGGYPGAYRKNVQISRLENVQMDKLNSIIFHAGTKLNEAEALVTNGGRVFAVTSYGTSIKDAVDKSKQVLSQIHFDGMYFRRDIGWEFE